MKSGSLRLSWQLLLPGLLALPGSASGSAVTPLQKVLELLGGMLEKAKHAKHEEVLQWTAYKQYCTHTDAQKQEDVTASDTRIELLDAAVKTHDAEAVRLDKEIKGHEADIVGFKKDLGDSVDQRAAQHKIFKAKHKDLEESVSALQEAIRVLQQQAHDRPQGALLLEQLRARSLLPKAARQAIEAFLERDSEEPDLTFVAPPEANAYEFQSQGIIDMLRKLLDKFVSERTATEKQEMTERHAQETLAQDLKSAIEGAKREIGKKSLDLARNKQASADAGAQLDAAMSLRTADMMYLTDLRKECQDKQAAFDSRQKLRSDEIGALEQALALLSSETVAGAAAEHLPALLQRGRGAALVQYTSVPDGEKQDQVASYLRRMSERYESPVLSALATRVQSDPFVKVKKLISDLIARLEEEQKEEAQHKQWCDQELGTNLQTRTDKTTLVESLHTKIDQLKASIATLEKEIALLSEELAKLQKAFAEAAKLRSKEKAENEDTIAEAVAAQIELSKAMKLLKDFYAGAAGATALAQRASGRAPPIFDAPYTGQQTESGNVMAFLQVILSDFARLESDTSAAEKAAVADHEQYKKDTEKTKATKEAAVKSKNAELTSKKADLQAAMHDLEMAQTQLDAALAYYDRLRPSCLEVASSTSHEERVQRREAEIASLQEALKILSGETIPDSGPEAMYSSVSGGNRGMDVGVTVSP